MRLISRRCRRSRVAVPFRAALLRTAFWRAAACSRLDVSFQEVFHSVWTVNADVAGRR